MRIETFKLKGLLRFQDEVGVDLRPIPPGLINFTGANGEGKTALMEAAFGAIWRELPSRSDRELLDYATSRESFVETTFAIDGQGHYRARVNLDGPKRNSDAVLEQILPDGRRHPLTDGRVSMYDEYIAAHFPPKDLVLASAFAAQNRRGSFVTLGKKERRDLFAQLLGLERYEAMSSVARTSAAQCEQARDRQQALRDVLARETTDGVGAELDRLELDLDQRHREGEARQADAARRIGELETRLATMQAAVAAYAAAQQRINTLKTEQSTRQLERTSLAAQRGKAERDHAGELKRIAAKLAEDLADVFTRTQKADTQYAAEYRQISDKLAVDQKDIDDLLANNRLIQSQAAEIRAAVARVANIDDTLVKLRAEVERREGGLKTARQQLQQADAELRTLIIPEADLQRAKTAAAVLADVPCAGAGVYASCQLLTDAQAAKARIPALEQQVAGKGAIETRIRDLREAIAGDEHDLQDLKADIAERESDRAEQQKTAKRADKLAASDARIDELTKTRARIETDATVQKTAATNRRDSTIADLAALPDRLNDAARKAEADATGRFTAAVADFEQLDLALYNRLLKLTEEIDVAQGDVDDLTDKNQRAIAIQVELKDAREAEAAAIRIVALVEGNQVDLQRRRVELAAKRQRIANLEARIRIVETELYEWQSVAKATSREGLPTIETAAAGPAVASYANDLMNVAFGPRFTLELVTEQAKRDGKGTKEVFSIAVLDNARGGDVRDISDLSGGEQVIVDEALKNALCIYMNQRAQMPMRTCWRDETTGPLDVDNAPRYIQMLRRVQELAGFHHVLFVSHNPDCTALADVQIWVHDGRADVLLPPFVKAQAAA